MSYREDERRREIHRALLEQALQPSQSQTVSGRVVPYHPLQGAFKIAQAYMARQGLDRADRDTEAGEREAIQSVMDAYQGQAAVPQTGGPLRSGDTYEPFTPAQEAVPGDPQKAAMLAATNPYISNNKGISTVLSAMMGNNRGSYTTPLEVYDPEEQRIKVVSYDHRAPAGRAYLDEQGNPYTKPIISRRDAEARGLVKRSESYHSQAGEQEAQSGGSMSGGAPPSQAELAARKKAAEKKAEMETQARTQAQLDFSKVESDAEYLKDLVNQAVNHPGMPGAVGTWSPGKVASFIPGTKEADFMKVHDQIFGKAYEEAYQSLKGAGQITEFEATTVARAKNRMATATSEEAYKEAAQDYLKEIDRIVTLARKRAGIVDTSAKVPATQVNDPLGIR